jgi:hypothetical protein
MPRVNNDKIKLDFKERIEQDCMDWIQMAQVAVKRWPLAHTIMNFRAAYNAKKILTSAGLTQIIV